LSEQSVGEVIRLATYDDRALVAALRRAWVEENSGGPIEDDDFERRLDEWLRREEHQRLTWLGLVDDQPVAMVNMLVFTRMPRPGTEVSQWGYLANFYVRPENRDAALGTRLLAALTAYADEHGFVRVILSPSERSVPFYERGGFSASNALMLRTPASVDGTSPHR
jgi:GNAT superfamily N-acetyltransferase